MMRLKPYDEVLGNGDELIDYLEDFIGRYQDLSRAERRELRYEIDIVLNDERVKGEERERFQELFNRIV